MMPVPAQFRQGLSLPDGCFTLPVPSQIVQVCLVVMQSSIRFDDDGCHLGCVGGALVSFDGDAASRGTHHGIMALV